MAKLHIYKRVGDFLSKVADGDGIACSQFTVTITSCAAEVQSGHTYEICQGQASTGSLYACSAVNSAVATFRTPDVRPDGVASRIEDFNAALDAVSKSVEILIDLSDLELLKQNGYSLCFAKKVGSNGGAGLYNVVWQSLADYIDSTTLSWTAQFALFGTNNFQENAQVDPETNVQVIGLGEQSTLDASGVLGTPNTGGSPTAITMINDYGAVHPGLQQVSMLSGVAQSTPIYVAQDPAEKGEVSLTPIDMVLVWFEQAAETSTMFSTVRSMSVEIDLTNTNSTVRRYQQEAWVPLEPSACEAGRSAVAVEPFWSSTGSPVTFLSRYGRAIS